MPFDYRFSVFLPRKQATYGNELHTIANLIGGCILASGNDLRR